MINNKYTFQGRELVFVGYEGMNGNKNEVFLDKYEDDKGKNRITKVPFPVGKVTKTSTNTLISKLEFIDSRTFDEENYPEEYLRLNKAYEEAIRGPSQ